MFNLHGVKRPNCSLKPANNLRITWCWKVVGIDDQWIGTKQWHPGRIFGQLIKQWLKNLDIYERFLQSICWSPVYLLNVIHIYILYLKKIGKHHSMQCTSLPMNRKKNMEKRNLQQCFCSGCCSYIHVYHNVCMFFVSKLNQVSNLLPDFYPEKLGKVATTFRTFSERCV